MVVIEHIRPTKSIELERLVVGPSFAIGLASAGIGAADRASAGIVVASLVIDQATSLVVDLVAPWAVGTVVVDLATSLVIDQAAAS